MSWTIRRGHLCAAMLGIAALLVGAPAASAHTDFDSSTPAHGDVVAEPVSSVVVVFSADTQPVDDLLVALDVNGNLQAPSGFTTQDQRTFNVTFDPPLAGGDIGIRWTVLAADGHALEGSFAFNVTAPPPTTPPPAPVEPVDTIADVDDASVPASDTVVVEEIEPAPAQQSSADELADPDGPFPDAAPEVVDSAAGAEVQSLDDFLIVAETSVPGRVACCSVACCRSPQSPEPSARWRSSRSCSGARRTRSPPS